MREMKQYERLLKQFARYFGAALVGFVVDFGTLVLLHEIAHVYYLAAATCGFILGLIVVYILSNRYVFGESKIKSKSAAFGLFALIGVVGLLLLNGLMWIFTDLWHINYIVSKIIATVFVYAWNFFARRKLYHD
jgi:putative flippase GtrA